MPQAHTASYCASRVAQLVISSRSSVLGPRSSVRGPRVHAAECLFPGLLAGLGGGEEHAEIFLRAGLRGANRADHGGRPAVHAGRALRSRRREDQAPDQGRPTQGDLLGDKAADGEPEQVYLAEPERGDEGDRVPRHLLDRVAVMPAEPPTPALSKVITRRNRASASTSAGSQESRLPRKCWSSTSGTAPS
jgi:hypothetical protein